MSRHTIFLNIYEYIYIYVYILFICIARISCTRIDVTMHTSIHAYDMIFAKSRLISFAATCLGYICYMKNVTSKCKD